MAQQQSPSLTESTLSSHPESPFPEAVLKSITVARSELRELAARPDCRFLLLYNCHVWVWGDDGGAPPTAEEVAKDLGGLKTATTLRPAGVQKHLPQRLQLHQQYGGFRYLQVLVDRRAGVVVKVFRPSVTKTKDCGVVQASGGSSSSNNGADSLPSRLAAAACALDMQGTYILPGLHDAHIHLGFSLFVKTLVDLAGCTTVEEVAQRVREHKRLHPSYFDANGGFVFGCGFDEHLMTNTPQPSPIEREDRNKPAASGYMLDRFELDRVLSDIPVALYRRCFHTVVCNTCAMKKWNMVPEQVDKWCLGIDDRFVCREHPTVANGIFKEGAIVQLLFKHFFGIPLDEMAQRLEDEMAFVSSMGLTAVQTCDYNLGAAYDLLSKQNRMKTRVLHTVWYEDLEEALVQERQKIWTEKTHGNADVVALQKTAPEKTPAALRKFVQAATESGGDLDSMLQKYFSAQRRPLMGAKAVEWTDSVDNLFLRSSTEDAQTKSTDGLNGLSQQHLVSVDRVKVFSDGSMGNRTAAVRTPYLCKHGSCSCSMGLLRTSHVDVAELCRLFLACNLRTEIHAIGDRACENVLNGLTESGMTGGWKQESRLSEEPADKCEAEDSQDKQKRLKLGVAHRPVVTHCALLGEDLIHQLVKVGGVANVQPPFVPSDTTALETYLRACPSAPEKSVKKCNPGDEVLKYAYVWKSIWAAGVACSGGSDAPVEIASPLKGIRDAMYRPTYHVLLDSDRAALKWNEARRAWRQKLAGQTQVSEWKAEVEKLKAADMENGHAEERVTSNGSASAAAAEQGGGGGGGGSATNGTMHRPGAEAMSREGPVTVHKPEECLTFAQALCMYTRAAAYAGYCDADTVDYELRANDQSKETNLVKLGEIAAGFAADFTVLNQDVSKNSWMALQTTQVLQTWVSGNVMFDASFP